MARIHRDRKGRFISIEVDRLLIKTGRVFRCVNCGKALSRAASYMTKTGQCKSCFLQALSRTKTGRTPNTKCQICGKPLYRRPWQLKKQSRVSCRRCEGKAIKAHPEVYEKIAHNDYGNRFKKGVPMSDAVKAKLSVRHKELLQSDRHRRVLLDQLRLGQYRSKRPTSLEIALYKTLLSLGIPFERQKLINNRFIVDAYIPECNLVIEADGEYWHSLLKVVHKDKAENAYLSKCGYKVLRLSERSIYSGNHLEALKEVLA